MKVLLHICCAPCAIHPFQELSKDGENSVTGFFYNPNIHPFTEMDKRRQAVVNYAKSTKFDFVSGEYDMENFFKNIGINVEAPSRCNVCWRMRLEKTARYAAEEGFDAFTSTLLVSPYQNRGIIVKIGSDLAAKYGVMFLSNDWREGFRQAQQSAKEHGIYRQRYCGCVYSQKR